MSKPTPGPWTLTQDSGWPWDYKISGALGRPALQYGLLTYSTKDTQSQANARPGNSEAHANARLFFEAGQVHHETGLTPRELAAQRAELLAALQGVMDAPEGECFDWSRARAAIARAAGQAKKEE